MDGNKQLRLYDASGKYIGMSVDEVIANRMNSWQAWRCSAGIRYLYIDYDGNIFICNTAAAHVIDQFWKDAWDKRVEEIKVSLNRWDLTDEEYRPYEEEWRVMISKQDFSFSDEYIGKIGGNIKYPYDWTVCPFESCACGADVIVSKAETYEASKMLAVTHKGYDGQFDTLDQYAKSIDGCVGVEMDFPIPHQILWDLTRRCNYNCSYCWPYVHNKSDSFLPFDAIMETCGSLIYKWASNKEIRFNFGGGEPTLHPRFVDILKYLKSEKQWILVTTNASRSPSFWREAVKYINSINMSAHFEFINKKRFLENLIVMLDHHDKVAGDHWIEIKLMCPPGKVDEATAFRNEIDSINRLHKPGANKRMKGVCSLVPIRQLMASGEMNEYSEEELCQLQNQ